MRYMPIVAILIASSANAASVEYFDQAAFQSAAGTLQLETFDGFATGTVLSGNEFSGFSISSRRLTAVDPTDFSPVLGTANLNSQPNGISASIFYHVPGAFGFDNGDDNFDIEFDAGVASAGLFIGNLGCCGGDLNPTIVSFLDAADQVIASESLSQATPGLIGTGTDNNRIFYGITSTIPIAAIEILNPVGDGDGILLDDVQYAAVPVPPAAWLFGSALGVLGWIRRSVR